MDPKARMHLATRMHYALLRYLGTGIEANRMIGDASYAREVLFVCEGSKDEVLQELGRQFAATMRPPGTARPASAVGPTRHPPIRQTATPQAPKRAAAAARPAVEAANPGADASGRASSLPAPQDATWAGDTSGFGFVTPSDFEDERMPRRPPGRVSLTRWLRRDGRQRP